MIKQLKILHRHPKSLWNAWVECPLYGWTTIDEDNSGKESCLKINRLLESKIEEGQDEILRNRQTRIKQEIIKTCEYYESHNEETLQCRYNQQSSKK